MSEPIKVGEYKNIPIEYHMGKKQFLARLNGETIRGASQREVERKIDKLTGGRKKIVIVHTGWIDPKFEAVEMTGVRGGHIRYTKNGSNYAVRSYDETVFEHDEALVIELEKAIKEYKAWEERWKELMGRFESKRVKAS